MSGEFRQVGGQGNERQGNKERDRGRGRGRESSITTSLSPRMKAGEFRQVGIDSFTLIQNGKLKIAGMTDA